MEGSLTAAEQQQVTDSIAMYAQGNYEATQWLQQLAHRTNFDVMVRWLLDPDPSYPAISVDTILFRPLQLGHRCEVADAFGAVREVEALRDFDENAKLAAFQLLLKGIKLKWNTEWTEQQKESIQNSTLNFIYSRSFIRHDSQPFSLLMKASQCLAAMCFYCKGADKAAAMADNHLLQLASWASGLSPEVLRSDSTLQSSLLEKDELLVITSRTPPVDTRQYSCACVFLGFVRELCLDLNEDGTSSVLVMPSRGRRLLVQALQRCLDSKARLLFKLICMLLLRFCDDSNALSKLKPLAVDCIRSLASFADVSTMLQCLCVVAFEDKPFAGLESQLLQVFDILIEQLSRKKHRRVILDTIEPLSLATFCFYLVSAAEAVIFQASADQELDEKLFGLQLLVASVFRNFVENCGEHVIRCLDPCVIAVLFQRGLIPILTHPSIRIGTCGVAAALALIRKLQTQQMQEVSTTMASAQLRGVPEWLDIPALLSALFVRCMRLGDPQLLPLLFPTLIPCIDDLVNSLLNSSDSRGANSVSAALKVYNDELQKLQLLAPQQDIQHKVQLCRSTLRALSTFKPLRPKAPVENWPQVVALHSEAEDNMRTEALEGFAARFAGMKSTALMTITFLFGCNKEITYATAECTLGLCRRVLGDPLFAQRHEMPDSLLVRQCAAAMKGETFYLPDKQQPYLCPSFILLDPCCCFIEALVQRLKNAVLTFSSVNATGTPGTAATVEWMIPSKAGDEQWMQTLVTIFNALVRLQLFDGQKAFAAEAAFMKLKNAAASGEISPTTHIQSFCLHDYLLEMRRLECVSNTCFLANYKNVEVGAILDLLFRHILADVPASCRSSSNVWAYPLEAALQVDANRRSALYTLISMCSSCASTLKDYLPLLLQHVRTRIHGCEQRGLLDSDRSLLIEAFVSLVSATQNFSMQQEHTLPLIAPFRDSLIGLGSQIRVLQQEFTKYGGAGSHVDSAIGLVLYMFGDTNKRLTRESEDSLASKRRMLTRVLAALDTCIKRCSVPTDIAVARTGGYIQSVRSCDGMEVKMEDLTVNNSFGDCLEQLLQRNKGSAVFARRHPLCNFVQQLLPVLLDFVELMQKMWSEQITSRFTHLRSLLAPGEEEFLSVHGSTSSLSADASTLTRIVWLTFPPSPPFDAQNEAVLRRQQDVLRSCRRQCFHVRTTAYRLLGSCAAVTDGFYLFPQLDSSLRRVLFQPLSLLPLQHIDQQLRLVWAPILDLGHLPPQRPYPSLQLILLLVKSGIFPLLDRLRLEWDEISRAKISVEDTSSSREVDERRMNLYLLHVYAASNLGGTILQLVKNFLQLKTSQIITSAVAPIRQTNCTTEEVHVSVEVGSITATKDEEGSTAHHANELRKAIYTSPVLVEALLTVLLEAQKWPHPPLIREAHAMLRTYAKFASKHMVPPPPCTFESCRAVLNNVLSNYLDENPFDPLFFGSPSTMTMHQQQLIHQPLSGCTPMQEFLNGGDSTTGGASYVMVCTATVYENMKALLRCAGADVATNNRVEVALEPLLRSPHVSIAFGVFKSTELPKPLNDDELHAVISAILQGEVKDGKSHIRDFLQRNRSSNVQIDGKVVERMHTTVEGRSGVQSQLETP